MLVSTPQGVANGGCGAPERSRFAKLCDAVRALFFLKMKICTNILVVRALVTVVYA